MTALQDVGGCQKLQSYVKLTQSKARGHDQVKVIFGSYTKVFDVRTAENLVTVTRKTNSDCPVSICVSIPKDEITVA